MSYPPARTQDGPPAAAPVPGSSGPRPGPSRLVRPVAATAGGLLLYLATAPHGLWWSAPLGFALLAAVLRGRGYRAGLGLGTLFGLGYFVPLLPWIGIYVGPVPWLVLAALQAVFLGVGCGLIGWTSRLPGYPVWAAAVWVATEAATSRAPFGGFPWGKVAFTQDDGPMLGIAALGGTPLVSFAVVLTGAGLAELVRRLVVLARGTGRAGAGDPAGRRGSRIRRLPWPAAACAVVPVLVGALAPGWLTGADGSPGRTVTVATVQGSVPRLGLDFNAQRRAVLDYHVRAMRTLTDEVAAGTAPRPDLVIWPENSSDIDPLRNSDAYAEISAAVDRLGVPTMIGTVQVRPDGVHTTNTALVWNPGAGPVQRLDKRRVQPFGEYLPWRGFFRLLSPYADRAGNFVPGDGPGVAHLGDVPVGVAICWEVAFDDLVESSVVNGARMLAVPSNNATFGRSDMTYQQLAMSRLRAVEHDRAVAVAATTGVSAIIAPDGGELAHSAVFTPAVLVRQVPLRDTTTLATRFGAVPEWLLTALGLAAALLARRPGARRPERDRPSGVGRANVTTREGDDG